MPLPPKPKSVHLALKVAIATGLLLLAAGGWVAHSAYKKAMRLKMEMDTAVAVADAMAGAVKKAFNLTPQVSINSEVRMGQTEPIMEMATVSRLLQVEYDFQNIWAFSRKRLTLQGTYRISAGFDLKAPFSVNVDSAAKSIQVSLPQPKIFSVELVSYKVIRDEDGFINRVTPAEREQAIQSMRDDAGRKALGSGLLADAKIAMQRHIIEAATRHGFAVSFHYSESTTKK